MHLTDIDAIELLRKLLSSVQVPSWKENQDRISQWYKEIKSHQGLAEEFDRETSGPDAGLKKFRDRLKSIIWKISSARKKPKDIGSIIFKKFFKGIL